VVLSPGLRRAAPMGPKITGPGSSDVGAVGETQVRASPRGPPMDHPSSPGARPTGVSVVALSSPARTGRAMCHGRAPSLAPPVGGRLQSLAKSASAFCPREIISIKLTEHDLAASGFVYHVSSCQYLTILTPGRGVFRVMFTHATLSSTEELRPPRLVMSFVTVESANLSLSRVIVALSA
jgi:hypothetical protein